jgi:hypothetical protein
MMTFQGSNGMKVIFRGEMNVLPNCIILVMTARKIIKKGYEA